MLLWRTVTLASVLDPSGLPHEATSRLSIDSHVGEHEGNTLVIDDGLAHCLARSAFAYPVFAHLALLRILCRLLQGPLGETNSASSNERTSDIKGLHGH